MTEQEKQLLFKDLCARLPYGVKINIRNDYTLTMEDIELNAYYLATTSYYIEYRGLRPYLRPMSSMTKEEKKEFIEYAGYDIDEFINGRHYEYYLKDYGVGSIEKPSANYYSIDWLNAHHFDYRGLIQMGLALEAKEGMYNI